jgi:hypothetical protein
MDIDHNRILYRFRPPVVKPPVVKHNKVVKKQKDVRKELKNQEICLSTIKENNDPMDGMLDVFWEGDRIIWKNFIKHYCLCLMDSLLKINIFENIVPFQQKHIWVQLTPEQLETEKYRNLYNSYINDVLQDKDTGKILEILTGKQKLHKTQLLTLLCRGHFIFLSILKKYGFDMIPNIDKPKSEIKLEALLSDKQGYLRLISEHSVGISEEIFLMATNSLEEQYRKANKNFDRKIAWSNLMRIITCFPNAYLDATIEHIYPISYVAAFSTHYDNCSMWGHYTKGHKGICLIFQPKTDGKNEYIEFENGEKLIFTPINYDKPPPALNYFENIAHLPMPQLLKYWLMDGKDRSCKKFNRDEYWNRYKEKISYKYKDWDYEKEMRLVKEGIFPGEHLESKELNYKFEYLKGIIFGMRTDEKMKLDIMKIIDHKLRQYGKRPFEFYQAEYSSSEQKLAIRKLNLL